MLQYVAVCCSVLQCVVACCSVLQCFAVCCNVLQCVAVCCSPHFSGGVSKARDPQHTTGVLLRVAVLLQCVAVRCSALQCVAECSAMQCVAVCCSALQCATVSISAMAWTFEVLHWVIRSHLRFIFVIFADLFYLYRSPLMIHR